MRLQKALKKLNPGLDLAIILKKENIFYLTGFYPSAFGMLVLKDNPFLAVSPMDAALTSDIDIEVKVVKSFKKELKFKGKVGV